MRSQYVIFVLIAADIAVLAPPAQSGEAAGGKASFVWGGAGEESLERIRSVSHDYNFKLLLALKSGNYTTSATEPTKMTCLFRRAIH